MQTGIPASSAAVLLHTIEHRIISEILFSGKSAAGQFAKAL
jgi:hypothetical protein